MALVFDPEKSARNAAQRGLPFGLVEAFEWDGALISIDDRRDYGEVRLRVLGMLQGKVHALVVTRRGGDLRVISLRRANRMEVRRYADQTG